VGFRWIEELRPKLNTEGTEEAQRAQRKNCMVFVAAINVASKTHIDLSVLSVPPQCPLC